jgi:hypothetical protein
VKLELDENLGARDAQLLGDGACDVATVVTEALSSASDAGTSGRREEGT